MACLERAQTVGDVHSAYHYEFNQLIVIHGKTAVIAFIRRYVIIPGDSINLASVLWLLSYVVCICSEERF